MIDESLSFLVRELNQFLELHFPGDSKRAVLSGLVNQDGKTPKETDNKIAMTLVNIERETEMQYHVARRDVGDSVQARVSRPLNINVIILVSASPNENYSESCKLLSAVLSYFEGRPVFGAASRAELPDGLDKVSLEMMSLDLEQLSNLWKVVGAAYRPSIVYKVRMLTSHEGWVQEAAPEETGIES